MIDSVSSAAATKAEEPRQFFEKQLPGELPLSFETAHQLYQLATELFAIQPWDFLEDQDLILIKETGSGEICYCSIMGAFGEVFSIQVYLGAESYRFFRKIVSGKPITPADFFATVRGVSAEFVTAKEQTLPDRELLQALGHPKKRGRAPIFRAFRPGYHSWYVTESEARLLVHCLQGILAFCLNPTKMDAPDPWQQEDVFPLLVPKVDEKACHSFEIQLVKAPEPPLASPPAVELDESLLAGILRENFPREGVLEADHFFTSVTVGGKNERPACVHTALVNDADSGFAFKTELGKPGESAGELLVGALLGGVREGRFLPREVRVRRKDFKVLLGPLSERLGFVVRETKSLPALDSFKRSLLAMM